MSARDLEPQTNEPAAAQGRLVVHVVRQFWPNRGGLEDVVLNLCRRAVDAGYRIRVVTLNSLFSDPERALAAREMLGDIEIVRIPWRGSSRYPIAPSVLDHIRDADLVHVHAIDFFFDFLALTKALHRKPMIATTHGGFFHTKKFAAIKSIWFNTLTRFSSSRYRYIVGCSRSDMDMFAPVARRNLRLIENGADLYKFADRSSALPRKTIVSIGRFSVNKRLDLLIETLAVLRRSDPSWTLDIVGLNSDLTARDLEDSASSLGVRDAVHLHVGLTNEAVAEIIGRASIFASASNYEGFGLVAIEAMSAGLIPVLQPNAAYEALAKRHDIVRLADFSAPAAAAHTLESIWTDLQKDGARLRQEAMAQVAPYSWTSVARDYLDLYERALS
ncbi:glycosyltransferase family 4 protein [Rhizobium sp. G21]|uniref:glycosyltransferase family 4 protein n=1 Tax=Rhizobium sp. G21 TaxID=2758439 RepID=UPI0016008ADA|nr:glycosyltransferase family 4 protein [Rhizobium sp. G21]MBB1248935.1 glycosyltransferase family 4 protein [Rhizobium sp. G21]